MNWVAIDWGTTNVRFWLISEEGKLLSSKTSSMGMNFIKRNQYEPHILQTIDEWFKPSDRKQVIACGMIGATNGWVEAKYQEAPCQPVSIEKIIKVQTESPYLKVHIIPGIANYSPNHDVLRGEETQICGFLADNPNFEGFLCLPGTHTKWTEIKSGQVKYFRTFMTGELFDVLCKSSILRHSVDLNSWDDKEFTSSVETSLKCPEEISSKLFSIRAESLIGKLQPNLATSRLAGLLIGLELAGLKNFWNLNDVAIIGSRKLTDNYNSALNRVRINPLMVDSDVCTIKGLITTKERLS